MVNKNPYKIGVIPIRIVCTLLNPNIWFALFGLCMVQMANADEEKSEITIDTLEIATQRLNLIGIADSASQGIVPAERITNVPLLRPDEALEQVPGLIVAQHSGNGKANQYFLRGF